MRQDLETSGVTINYTVISWDWGYLSIPIPSPIPSSIPSPSHLTFNLPELFHFLGG